MSKRTHSGASGSGLKSAGSHIKYSIQDMLEVLIVTALWIADAEQARKRLATLVTSGFGSKFGKFMRELDERIVLLQATVDAVLAEIDIVREQLLATPEWVPASKDNHGRSADQHVETPIWRWQFRHQIGALVLALMLVLALGASAFTAHANIVGTGLPVFLENPLLPWSMAMLAPMSGLAIKTMISHIRYEGVRTAFTAAVMAATFMSCAAWLLTFSINYHGLSADVAIGGLFDEPTRLDKFLDTAFVAVTLSTEILVGAVIALTLGKIVSHYSPDYWIRNLEIDALAKRLAALEARAAKEGDALAILKGERVEYDESLRLQVEIALLAHDGRRGQGNQQTL